MLSLSAQRSSPVVGIGLGNFERYGQGLATFSHNFLLEALTELGLIGLVLLLAFSCLQAIRRCKVMHQREFIAAPLSALFAYSLVSMSFGSMLQGSVDFWIGLCHSHQCKQPACGHLVSGHHGGGELDCKDMRGVSRWLELPC